MRCGDLALTGGGVSRWGICFLGVWAMVAGGRSVVAVGGLTDWECRSAVVVRSATAATARTDSVGAASS